MRFQLFDRIIEQSEASMTTIKLVSNAEEYLQDHFPTFPVLPGVFMLEAMVQTARALEMATEQRKPTSGSLPPVLGRVRSLKYGNFVQPGDMMTIRVDRTGNTDDVAEFKGTVHVSPALPGDPGLAPPATAASGRFELRSVRM